MALRERAAQAFADAIERTGQDPALDGLRAALVDGRDHIGGKMRVALVGHIKAGKSTLLNALLGEELAATGTEELTFNVNWLRHGSPGLRVHFKDGREPRDHTLAELEVLSARREENRDVLAAIRYLEVHHPNPLLETFELIDTPGLKSFFGTDSLNTLNFLGLSADDVEAVTRDESGRADALLCLFTRSLAGAEQSVVADFQGPLLSHATPINAIGVLTKVDAYWDPAAPEADPLEEGARVAASIFAEPGAERVFYAVLPVCGLLAFGSHTLTAADLNALARLAAVPEELLTKRLRYAERFADREYDDLPVGPAERGPLVRHRLGQYGIWLSARLIRSGADESTLRTELWRRSGMAAVNDLVTSHFGHRALLIKAATSLRKGRDAAFAARREATDGTAERALAAGGALEALELGEPAFEELALLRRYYQDRDALDLREREPDELLRVTGEHGTGLAARLGLDSRALPAELVGAAEERLAHWRRRQAEFGAHPRTVSTARVMCAAYQRFLYHAREARRHLELDA
jgi:hypothetical protein